MNGFKQLPRISKCPPMKILGPQRGLRGSRPPPQNLNSLVVSPVFVFRKNEIVLKFNCSFNSNTENETSMGGSKIIIIHVVRKLMKI